MIFLAIETSCDETSLALFDDRRIVFHSTYSQIKHHKIYKGVVPEIASRLHSEKISVLIKKAELNNIRNIDIVGFTRGPGLKGSLLVGKIAAMTIGEFFGAKVIGINHLEGHLLACDIVGDKIEDVLEFPLICLIVSGGHTELWYCSSYGKYKVIGKTRDDACGESFDKVARMLGFNYPGGPYIEKASLKVKKTDINFTVPDVVDSLDYSFSGIKTQVMYFLRNIKRIDNKLRNEVSFAFQKAVCESLVKKLDIAREKFNVKNIAICGGVSANNYLRNLIVNKFRDCKIFFPQLKYTSDNAAMIGVCIFRRFQKGVFKNSLEISDRLPIRNWV
ncbi:MAG: tRNA (adenosine(37)-N6)-threonylcarbamoyltransferase complex transferase subunit TsaD [Elusimicrobiales bacterium]|nr:tRNA (adenosine(37)-N6)-threonylcarbamoyltransferase complex transferase subunit TsaD [Elusimicrobiales bacterium]